MKKMLLVLAISILGMSCENTSSQKQTMIDTYKIMNDIHLEAMEPYALLGNLEEIMDDLIFRAKSDSTVLKGHNLDEVRAILDQVEKSKQGMDKWMTKHIHYTQFPTEWSHKEQMSYIEIERQAITKVNDETKQSISVAKELLSELDMPIEEEANHDHGHNHSHPH